METGFPSSHNRLVVGSSPPGSTVKSRSKLHGFERLYFDGSVLHLIALDEPRRHQRTERRQACTQQRDKPKATHKRAVYRASDLGLLRC